MKRREFITLLVGATVAWPVAARAQQPTKPVIGLLSSGSPDALAPFIAAFRRGLNETGYDEGQNVAIEHRSLEGQYDRMPAIAADFVQRRVAVIVTLGQRQRPPKLPHRRSLSSSPSGLTLLPQG
jgi:putative tryptophan/tyrosine transport system substrate-binding protein